MCSSILQRLRAAWHQMVKCRKFVYQLKAVTMIRVVATITNAVQVDHVVITCLLIDPSPIVDALRWEHLARQ